MAAPPPLLLSLLLLAFSSFSYCSDEGTTNDVIIQYWNLKFPKKPLPSFFLSKLPPPSPLRLMATSKLYGNPATANYDSKAYREPVTAKYEAYRKPITANYDSKAFGRPVTAGYDSEESMTPITANYDSGSDKHATASYSSDAYRKPVTVNYDSDPDAGKKPVTANDDSNSDAYKKPVTANYDSGEHGIHATTNYGSREHGYHATENHDSGARGNHATADYGSKARGNHATADYGSKARGNHATANYDSGERGNHATVNYGAHGNHATANYGAHGNHATANYDIKPKANRYHATTKNDASNSNNIRMVTANGATGKVAKRPSNLNVFFRESNLTRGTIMPMCDIKATMPQMSFLPRSIATMLPFSSPHEVKKHFRIPQDSRMSEAIDYTVSNCNSDPSEGETKACLTSAEDLIDFVRSKLGPTATLKNTESAGGSEGVVMVGEVRSVKGDELTELVACHQAVFPYMVYLCHSVPKVKIYEADILDVETKEKINHGVAICHFDTSNWSEGHTAFIELGFKPGEIEACHWIFEGEMAAFAE